MRVWRGSEGTTAPKAGDPLVAGMDDGSEADLRDGVAAPMAMAEKFSAGFMRPVIGVPSPAQRGRGREGASAVTRGRLESLRSTPGNPLSNSPPQGGRGWTARFIEDGGIGRAFYSLPLVGEGRGGGNGRGVGRWTRILTAEAPVVIARPAGQPNKCMTTGIALRKLAAELSTGGWTMRRAMLASVLLFVGLTSAVAEPVLTRGPDNAILKAAGLATDEGCAYGNSKGRVLSVQVARGVIEGFRFDDSQYGESYINIDLSDASPAIRAELAAWLKMVLKKGAKLELGLKGCGAGGRIEMLDAIAPQTVAAAAPQKAGPTGTIAGTLSYPSDYIPALIVCAEPSSGGEPICKTFSETPNGSYSLRVPPGSYFVYAKLADPNEAPSFADYRAYYTEHVKCGFQAECQDHSKIAVTVKAGKTVKKVVPADWYN